MKIPEPVKKILRPPYRLAKTTEALIQEMTTHAEVRFGAKSMTPPKLKVKKSDKLERILVVAMRYDYGFKERGLSYEYRNFFHAMKDMGFEVEYFDFLTIFQEEGKQSMNKQLGDKVEEFKPDLVFFNLYQEQFNKKTVRKISEETSAKTFNWFADDDWRFHIYTKFWAPSFNYCGTTIKEAVRFYHALGYHNVIQTQWAANEKIYRKTGEDGGIDISFVGQPHSNRRELVSHIEKKGYRVECFGNGWPNGFVDQERMISIFNRSKINLNFTANSTGAPAQIKGRFFEVTACGGFLLSEYAKNLEDYFEIGKELEVFDGKEELIEKISRYLENDNERERIADAGYKRTVRDHTYAKRLDDLFRSMGYKEIKTRFDNPKNTSPD